MTALLNLQNMFQAYLLNGQPTIENHVIHSAKVSAAKRLDIYGDAYRSRLLECLASNYPVFKRYIGPELFEEIGNTYIEQYPSSYRSIRWYGDNFSHYLEQNQPKTHSYLAELAHFEWCLNLAFDAADADVLTVQEMAAVPPESWADMTFTLHPSLQQLNFFWNVAPIWQAVANEQVPDKPVRNAKQKSWGVWRSNYTSRFYSLADDEAWALAATMRGANFGEICTGLCEWLNEEEVGLRAASLLKGWIELGLITKIRSE
ncbi:Uncharacterized protein conserved in bacteria [Legionella lansingensis]|uniref:Putative DNA-binding domain-containing protein n=1 Tax=Legionella lansingensis TaxID=45067 RepID=A0A0W0VXJ8_9GAMM|nr:DNA-binding domain-containing protein [Legionella lansingensis]KTD24721.1 hypothetical protein Llan_0415 [Legionella lansingensis]SNV53553.1 Uncharacterized protein conserved in bacteria [Legionella lansingensis]